MRKSRTLEQFRENTIKAAVVWYYNDTIHRPESASKKQAINFLRFFDLYLDVITKQQTPKSELTSRDNENLVRVEGMIKRYVKTIEKELDQ
jgi:hypothetical protein